MTATAMIIGMLPMALGLGEGGEQNAPLGRSVIGGLLVATFATLLFVPVVYSYIHRNAGPLPPDADSEDQPAPGETIPEEQNNSSQSEQDKPGATTQPLLAAER